ncbi:MAG: LacI family DNA-binding transcriptional regulator [Butyrivibrio sp.]|nr:LacI family DNA-binding transcriptional regulator [Butyrivibrio sp.]
MKDVATEANVALGTVSKVFNGLPVGDEYKVRVEKAARKLGYQVNEYARGLRASKTYTIALILPNVQHPFYSSMADYCCEILGKQGYRVLLATTTYDPALEQKCVDMVQQNKVDGIIGITYNPDLDISDDIPFVIIDRKFNNKVPCVSCDNFSGGELAAQKLVENGCNNLLFIGESSPVAGEADKRILGFKSYCETNDIKHTEFRLFDNEKNPDKFHDFIDKNSKNGKFAYDGIFCNTDFIARMVMKYLRNNGLSVPEDVQIIGFDGIKNFGFDEYYCSTIRQPLREMAEAAVDILLNKDRASAPALVCLPVTYCYGGTTKK